MQVTPTARNPRELCDYPVDVWNRLQDMSADGEVETAVGCVEGEDALVLEAKARLGSYGRNELAAEKPTPAWRKFLAQFQDVLVILLLIATGVSLALWIFERE